MRHLFTILASLAILSACTATSNVNVNPSPNPGTGSSASPQPAASSGVSIGGDASAAAKLSTEPWKTKQSWIAYLNCLNSQGNSAAINAWIAGANTVSDANWAVSGATSAQLLFGSSSKQYAGKCLS